MYLRVLCTSVLGRISIPFALVIHGSFLTSRGGRFEGRSGAALLLHPAGTGAAAGAGSAAAAAVAAESAAAAGGAALLRPRGRRCLPEIAGRGALGENAAVVAGLVASARGWEGSVAGGSSGFLAGARRDAGDEGGEEEWASAEVEVCSMKDQFDKA